MKSPWKHSLVKPSLLQAKHVKYFMWIIQRAHCVYTRFPLTSEQNLVWQFPLPLIGYIAGPSVEGEAWELILAHVSRPRASLGFYNLPHHLAPHKLALGVSRRAATKRLRFRVSAGGGLCPPWLPCSALSAPTPQAVPGLPSLSYLLSPVRLPVILCNYTTDSKGL